MSLKLLSQFRKVSKPEKVRIGEVLLRKRVITQEQLEQALVLQRASDQKLGYVLIQEGLITRKQLERALTTQYWQNLTATAFLSFGTLATALPQVATAQFVVTPRHSQQEHIEKAEIDQKLLGINHAYLATNGSDPIPVGESNNEAEVSLAANSNPTEANPLRGFLYPLDQRLSTSQGYRGRSHNGRMEFAIDIAVGIGTPVYAMRSGKVVGIEDRFPDTGGGPEKMSKFNYVWIEHDGGYRSAYLHLQQGFASKVQIRVGDRVPAGQLIGFSGNSGWSSGPHLHVEIHKPQNRVFGQTVPFEFDRGLPTTVALH